MIHFKYHCTTDHVKSSLRCRTYNSQLNSLDSSVIWQLPTPKLSIRFSAATAISSHLSSQSSTLDSNFSESETELLYGCRFVLATSPLRLKTSNFIFQLNTCGYCPYVTFSLTKGWVCRIQLLLVLASAVVLSILLSHIRDTSNLHQVPVFITPGDGVAQLYPQALGSLFVASYDSQSYGGGILPRLHRIKSTVSNNIVVVVCLPIRCLETGSSTVARMFISRETVYRTAD
jgi:hypothetical protein